MHSDIAVVYSKSPLDSRSPPAGNIYIMVNGGDSPDMTERDIAVSIFKRSIFVMKRYRVYLGHNSYWGTTGVYSWPASVLDYG